MASAPLLTVDDLHVVFRLPHTTVEAVKGVSFDLQAAQTLALVGESGSGKSVTAMSILRLLPRQSVSHPRGAIHYKGQDLLQATEGTLRNIRGNKIAMVFQEPMTALNPVETIRNQIAEAVLIHNPGKTKQAANKRVLELLECVHLPRAKQRLNAYPHELSGGQRQRIVIAMALANNPDILIADEPTTALDVTVQQKILELLVELQREFGMGILFITHDLTIVHKIADHVCIMKDGLIVEQGGKTVLTAPHHPYTRALLESNLTDTRKKPIAPSAPVLLGAKDVNVDFTLGRSFFGKPLDILHSVKQVSLSVREGETVGIVGESGSGKSTLGKALLGLLEDGHIAIEQLDFCGQNIHHLSEKQRRQQQLRKSMQIVFQDPFGSLSPRMTISQILKEGLAIHYPHLSAAEQRHKIEQSLADVGLHVDMINRYPHEFSGGQRQRIAIARSVILRPQFLFLDEPTSALDRTVQVQVVSLLLQLQEKYNLSYLFVSHDLAVVRAVSDYVMVMKNGVVVEQGNVEQIFTDPQTDYARNLIEAAFDTTPITAEHAL